MDTTVARLASIGVDIGKEVFHLVGFGTDGEICQRRSKNASAGRSKNASGVDKLASVVSGPLAVLI